MNGFGTLCSTMKRHDYDVMGSAQRTDQSHSRFGVVYIVGGCTGMKANHGDLETIYGALGDVAGSTRMRDVLFIQQVFGLQTTGVRQNLQNGCWLCSTYRSQLA